MASKKKKTELEGFKFERQLDIPDFPDFDLEPPKDNRKPITKLLHGIKDGIKSTATDGSFIRSAVQAALPKAFTSTFDLVDKTNAGMRELYNTTAKDIKPVANEMKRTVARAMPLASQYMPKSLSDKMKEWADTAEKAKRSPTYDPNEALLQATLGDMLKTQLTETARVNAVNDVKSTIRDTIEQARHRDTLGQLNSIRDGVANLVGYQNKVTAGWQRKTLELQYRQYFVLTDSLAEAKKSNQEVLSQLQMITKNTGLPDYVKLNTSERIHEAIRNRFIGGGIDSFMDKRRNFVKNFFEEIKKTTKRKTGNTLNNFRAGLGASNQMIDAAENDEPGPDRYDAAGNMIGGFGATTIAGRMGKWSRNYLETKSPRAMELARKAGHYATNAQQNTTQWARGDKGDYIPIIGGGIRAVKDAALKANRLDTTIQMDSLRAINEPMPYTRQANKSITEIIPGYLARILRELQITRTGDASTELTAYDYTKNKFDTSSTAKKNAFSNIVNANTKKYTTEDIESLMTKIDPGGRMSPEQRKIMGQRMLDDNMSNKTSSGSRLSQRKAWLGGEGTQHADLFADVMKQHFSTDTSSRQTEFDMRYQNLGRYINPANANIQTQVNAGLYDYLEEMQMLNPDGTINSQKLQQYFYSGDFNPAGGPNQPPSGPPIPPGPGGKKKKKKQPPHNPQPWIQNNQPPVPPQQQPPTPLPPGPAPTINIPPADYTEIIKTIKERSEITVDTIKEQGIKSVAEQMQEVLLRIEKRLNDGILTILAADLTGGRQGGEGGPPGGPGGGGGPPGPGGGDDGKWWFQKTLGSNLNSLAKFGWKGTKFAARTSKNIVSGSLGAAWGGLKMGVGGLKRTADIFIGLRDVFVPGEDTPRLFAYKLKAGHYMNKTDGKPIYSFRDITGAVLDENGDTVLTDEEAKKAFVRGQLGKKLISGLGAVIKLGGRTLSGVAKLVPAAMRMGWKVGSWAAKKGWGLLDQPQDVYVKGQEEPALLKVTMKSAGYFSKRTRKPIMKVSDIDGPVVDEDGEIVLSKKMIAQGLMDKNGKPIKTGLAKLIGIGGKLIGGATNLAVKGVMGVARGVKGAVDGVLGLAGGAWDRIFGDKSFLFLGSKKVASKLDDIYRLLDERLPGKKVAGDLTGDGVRDGSVEDLRKKKKERDEAREKRRKDKQDSDAAKAAGGGGLLGGIKGLLDKLRGKDKDKEDDDGPDALDVANAAGDAVGGGDDKKKKRRRRRRGGARRPPAPLAQGWKAKMGRGLKGAGSILGRGAGFLGRGALGLIGLGGIGLGGVASAAGAVASGVGSLAMGAASVAGTALAGLASIVASPIVLTGLAIAAVGAAGYYGYKHFTKNNMGSLQRMRYVQYGFSGDNPQHVSEVFGLEAKLQEALSFNANKEAQINEKKLDLKKLVEDFGVDIKNPRDREKWVRWFANRFKPLFLMHCTVLNSIKQTVKLEDVDNKLTVIEKKAYLDQAKYPSGPYDEMISPMPGKDRLSSGPDQVKAAVEKAYADLAAENKKPLKMGESIDKSTAAAVAGATAGGALAVAGAAKAGDKSVADLAKGPQKNSSDLRKIDSKGFEGNRGLLLVAGGAVPLMQTKNGQIDGLTALRYKTYGLNEMEADKVRSLAILEDAMSANLTFGANKVASWSGDPSKMLAEQGGAFGVTDPNSQRAANWLVWFSTRFLPTYLNFASGTFAGTGKGPQPGVLPPPAVALDTAALILGSNSVQDGSAKSVFLVTASPWDGYVLNSDSASTTPNMDGLKEAAKSAPLIEKVGKERQRNPDGTFINDASGNVQKGPGSVKKEEGFFSKVFGTEATDTSNGSGIRGWLGRQFGAGASADILEGGNAIVQPGNGTGGDINAIPMPTGNGSYEGLKALIDAASAMAGVDPKLMATMAAVESDFNYKVQADTSSATGLYQFTSGTWGDMMKNYAKKYGIDPRTPRSDPRANALMGAEYIKENANALKGTKANLTDTDLYLAHFLGAGGARKFLKSKQTHIAADILPDAASKNKSIFYDITSKPRTIAEVYAELNRRVQTKGKKFGLGTSGGGAQPIVESKGGAAPAAAAAATVAGAAAGAAKAPETTKPKLPSAVLTVADSSGSGMGMPPTPAPSTPLPKVVDPDLTSGLSSTAAIASLGSAYAKNAAGGNEYERQAAKEAGGGFGRTQKIATAKAQQDFQKASIDPVFASIDGTLSKSLAAQIEAVVVLKELKAAFLANKGITAKELEDATKQINATAKADKRPQRMVEAPVSVAKPL